MKLNILTESQIRKIVKEEVEKREFKMQQLIDILYKRVQKSKEELWCKYDSKKEEIVIPKNSSLKEGDEVKITSIKNKGGEKKW